MVCRGTVAYFVETMLKANVDKEKIVHVSRSLAFLFGVHSEQEAEWLTREYLMTILADRKKDVVDIKPLPSHHTMSG